MQISFAFQEIEQKMELLSDIFWLATIYANTDDSKQNEWKHNDKLYKIINCLKA